MPLALAVACGGDDEGAARPSSSTSTTKATTTTTATPPEPGISTIAAPGTTVTTTVAAPVPEEFAEFLGQSEEAAVLAGHGLGPAPLADLFRRLCDDFRGGAPVEELFVEYSDEVAARSRRDGPELRDAFADVFGAGVPVFCPEAVPRGR